MRALELGIPYYSPLEMSKHFSVDRFTNIKVACTIGGLNAVVVDNAEYLDDNDWAALREMDTAIVFGTLGPIDGDYKILSANEWKRVQEAIDDGIISLEFALREYNLVRR